MLKIIIISFVLALLLLSSSALAFAPSTTSGHGTSRVFGIGSVTKSSSSSSSSSSLSVTIAEGVEFDTVAREWRCKWSPDNDKASLVEAQKALEGVLADLKALDGVKSVERIVCGGCLDFKVITSLDAEKFGDWEGAEFKPEAEFLAKLESIDGISLVETQTFTKMPM
ncbi:hypothetical protein ACA910_002694 [Epithemia clementina (nom. ined.)]